ncbi:GAF domain-containing protein [Roseibium sediminicola]|uniref:GAF domain-containing protein n=1 Tax=Roseibium sediminicola TaxID=2933272 RepID=A0ABT0GN53_9HYPH|nr:GAF domain-containing protein [Roseibium sp. CAU 1639]MCK7610766.1 GAF domain-containing protein [Roseibium sp. CAU 1639]
MKEHVETVFRTVESRSAPAVSRIAASWRRSIERHGLHPGEESAPSRVDGSQLRQRRDRTGSLLQIAAPKLDQLFGLVGQSGCTVVLTDAEGVILDQRCTAADQDAFEHWGLAQGTDWSEASVGTNGVGTCIAEERNVIVHRDEHFLARNVAMSCMDAPIYAPDGHIAGALDVSSARSDQTEAFNRLIAAMVAQTARQIEVDTFRAAFSGSRIVYAEKDSTEAAMLLAVDADDIVIGATRGARKAFGLGAYGPLTPMPASDLLGREDGPTGFEKAERAAVMRALARAKGNVSEAARGLGVGRATLYRRMKRLGIGDN